MNVQVKPHRLTDKQRELRSIAADPTKKHILAVGGSRSGKSHALCYFIDRRAWKAPASRHLILRDTAVACRKAIGMDTYPNLLRMLGTKESVKWHKQDGYFEYPNESEVWVDGLDETNIDKILGREYATIWINEASEISFTRVEQVMTRLAQKCYEADGKTTLDLKLYCDLNPTTNQHWTYKLWFELINPGNLEPVMVPDSYGALFMNPNDNIENLPDGFVDSLKNLTALQRKRFLEGQYSADAQNGLWRRSIIAHSKQPPGDMDRIIVAIDPAVSNAVGSDETGIVVVGMNSRHGVRKAYVLEDASGRYSPEKWGKVAVALARTYNADCFVAEANQGGDLVSSNIKAAVAGTPGVPPRTKLVHATRNKLVRAEPIAGLYEQGLVEHVRPFPLLEDQMCSFTVDFDRRKQGFSPDRMDALVWGMTELFGVLSSTRRSPFARKTYDPKPRFF